MQETQDMWIRSLGWEDPLEEEMGKSHGQRILEVCSLWGWKESNMTECTFRHSLAFNKHCMNGDKEPACQCRRCEFASLVGKIPWRRKWPPTPVFLPGKSHGQRSLAGYSPCGRKKSDTVDWVAERACTHTLSSYDWSLFCLPLPQNLCSSGYLLLQFVPKIPCGVLRIFHLLLWPQLN